MLQKAINTICNGESIVKKIVVASNKPILGRHICVKGDKLMDRFFYISKGTFKIKEKGAEEIIAIEGTLLYLPRDIEYVSCWEEGLASYVAFNYCLYDENGNYLHLSNHITVALKDKNGEVYELLKKCEKDYIKNEKFTSLILQSYFYKILHLIFRQHEKRVIKTDKNLFEIYKAIIYLEDNYMFEISTDKLAEMCNLSESTFRRVFKKFKGISPMKYKQILRMNHAKDMLESGVYTVTEVADIMNCTDLSHFNRLYFSAFGINPSESKKHFD